MVYLHDRDPIIVHRDLKCMNILVDAHWVYKIADFGIVLGATPVWCRGFLSLATSLSTQSRITSTE